MRKKTTRPLTELEKIAIRIKDMEEQHERDMNLHRDRLRKFDPFDSNSPLPPVKTFDELERERELRQAPSTEYLQYAPVRAVASLLGRLMLPPKSSSEHLYD